MYKVKINQPQALAVAQRARFNAIPTLLVVSTATLVTAGAMHSKVAHCHHDSDIQAKAEHLKEHVQEFTDEVLEMSDSPYSNSSSSSSSSSSSGQGRERGHNSSFFSSVGHRGNSGHSGFGFRSESDGLRMGGGGSSSGKMERFRGAYVDKNEELVPAVLYIASAGVIGSFLARRSNFLVRFLSPIALAMGASAYCIPKTTNNVIYGLKSYNYTEWSRECQHKMLHAKKSLMDDIHGLQSGLGSVTAGAKDAVHDLQEKTHEISDKAQHVLHDVTEKSKEVAHDLQDKGKEVAKDLETAKDHVKDEVQDKTQHAKHWWSHAERSVQDSAHDLKKSAQEKGEEAKDWFQGRGNHRGQGYSQEDFERGFDRFKAKARGQYENVRHQWDETRDQMEGSFQGRGHEMKNKFEDWKDEGRDKGREMKNKFEDWKGEGRDQGREMKNKFEEWKGQGEDWAQDRRRDAKRFGREAEDHLDDARHELKKHGQEARDYGEDRFRDARRDIRNRAEDLQDHGRRQFHQEGQEMESSRRGGRFGGFGSRDREESRGRFENHDEYSRGGREGSSSRWGGRHEERGGYDAEPRRSVTEAAKEGKHWWQHKSPADPYESYDKRSSAQERPSWWKAGSGAGAGASRDAADQFDQAKGHFKHGMDNMRDSIEDKAEHGRNWFAEKTHDLKNRFEHTFEHGDGHKFGRGGDYRMGDHNHDSIFSKDNWFHYDHGSEHVGGGGRGRERGL